MSDDFERDELLDRLRAEDPAVRSGPEAPHEREKVRQRAVELLAGDPSPRRGALRARPRLVVAGLLAACVVGVGLFLILGSSTSGPAPALAIEKGKKWVTLKIESPSAPDSQMNSELEAAGIDRVRVISVPGRSGVGTWAGYAEFGPTCVGGVRRFGFGVDIPAAKTTKANRHSAENLIHLTVPHPHGGGLQAETLGTPYGRSVLRISADSIDNPQDSAKVLVPIRARSPADGPDANQIGASQLLGLGGVFTQYGQAIEDGRTSCADFGLKPHPKPTFPPSEGQWVVIHVTPSPGGQRKMTRELRAGGINGRVRQIPAQPTEVGHWLGFSRVPPLPVHYRVQGNRVAILPNDVPHVHGPTANDIALSPSAFRVYPNARWIIYVGRAPHEGERPEVIGEQGPEDAAAALKSGCKGLARISSPSGNRWCGSLLRIQVPAPESSNR